MSELSGNTVEHASDDFALTEVPSSARMHWVRILNVTIGIAGAMIFMQVSGQMALAYGTVNAVLANAYATVVTAIVAVSIARVAGQTGLNTNVMTRGAGFGFVGAALTSLVYASNFIVLAAIEGSIMAQAIYSYFPSFPLWLIMTGIAAVNIALNWYGITELGRFQKCSLPLYLAMIVSAILLGLRTPPVSAVSWLSFLPVHAQIGGVQLLTCIGILNGIVGVQSLLTADYARFLRKKELTLGSLAVGFVPQLASFFIMGLVGIWFAVRFGESNPGTYLVKVMGVWGAVYTVVSQLRINLINVYSGSLSLSNFFSRILGFAPGRGFWVIVTSVLALVVMLKDVSRYLGPVLTFQGVFMFSWAACLVADFYVVRRLLKIVPDRLEYRREYLHDWNPVGLIALLAGSGVGASFALVVPGTPLSAASAFIAGGISFALHVALSVLVRGRYHKPAAAMSVHAS